MPFQKVDAKRAGPAALGILVPQGTRTLVIVRPRALPWDLLPARWDGVETHAPEFCLFTRDEAAGAARRFFAALEKEVARGVNPVQSFGDASNACLQIWLRLEEFVWIACRRTPGQAYQPTTFATESEATEAADKIAAVVWPDASSRQEYYFNTQNFST